MGHKVWRAVLCRLLSNKEKRCVGGSGKLWWLRYDGQRKGGRVTNTILGGIIKGGPKERYGPERSGSVRMARRSAVKKKEWMAVEH